MSVDDTMGEWQDEREFERECAAIQELRPRLGKTETRHAMLGGRSKISSRRCLARHRYLIAALAIFSLGPAAGVGAAGVRGKAVLGHPYGVAEVSIPLEDEDQLRWQTRGIAVEEASQRILFQVVEHPRLFHRLASKLDGTPPDCPSRATVLFLFVGEAPLEIRVPGADLAPVRIVPERHRARQGRLMRRWWNQIWGPISDRVQDTYRPRPVENYLAGMGLWRLGIERRPHCPPLALGDASGLLFSCARLHSEASRLVSFARCPTEIADQPIPGALCWSHATVPDCGPVDTEPMAAQVPPDCFYVRFGKYSNLLWATRLLERQGEELQRLITARGYRGRFGEKVQSQLAIAELPFADLIGDQVIHDVALVGRDTYVADGAALGVILRAGNPILESGLATARRDAVAERADEGATKEALVIEGHPVSLISTPDRSLFSYHARRGPWHLLSNSHALVQDFLRIDQGRPSLADDPAFRRARSELPPDRADTLFLFVPTAFFEQALSPARLIELQRRSLALAELRMLRVAWAAYRADAHARGLQPVAWDDEGVDAVAFLQQLDFLPESFALRPDGSRPTVVDGYLVDSLRGGAGYFRPMSDLEVTEATAREVELIESFRGRNGNGAAPLDPVALRLRRTRRSGNASGERLDFTLLVAPLQRANLALLQKILGSPRAQCMPVDETSLASLQVVLNGQWTAGGEDALAQFCLRDTEDPAATTPTLRLVDVLRTVKQLDLELRVEPGDAAFDRSWWRPAGSVGSPFWYGPLELIGRKLDNYASIGWNWERLHAAANRVELEAVDDAAQVWFDVRQLRGSSVEGLVSSVAARRAMEGSLNNAHQFHQWARLLNLPVDGITTWSQQLVGLEAICPLGGAYECASTDGQPALWRSTAWGEGSVAVKDLSEYQPAVLRWFEGVKASLIVDSGGLRVSGHVDVHFEDGTPDANPWKLPFLGTREAAGTSNED